MFWLRKKKNSSPERTLIWRPGTLRLCCLHASKADGANFILEYTTMSNIQGALGKTHVIMEQSIENTR